MARLWKLVNGEPYMINPGLGVLSLPNPKRRGKKMAKHWGARHMAWVRHKKRNPSRRRYHSRSRKSYRKHNPYPMAGMVVNPYRRRKGRRRRNPVTSVLGSSRGALGLPPFMPVVWGGVGFIGTAMAQGFIDTLVPASWKTNTDGTPSMLTKYGEILASIVLVSFIGKKFLGKGGILGIGGGIYAATVAAHDFLPGVIPGMHSYTPLAGFRAYVPITDGQSPFSLRGMRGVRGVATSAGGAFPQLAAPDQGFTNTANFAAHGAMNITAERFRRF